MSARPRIILVGSMNFDCVAKADHLPRRGETVLGTSFGTYPGGKGANQAVQMGRLGAEVFMVGRVGDDFMADIVLSSLKAGGVITDFVRRDKSVTTGVACINVDQNGDNTIIIVPQANLACSTEDVDAASEVIRSADILLCQFEIALKTVAHAVSMAVRHGVRVILNPAPPAAQPLPEGLMAGASVLTPNETEAEALAGIPRGGGQVPSAPRQTLTGDTLSGRGFADGNAVKGPVPLSLSWESSVAGRLLAMGPPTVVLTLGDRGAYLATRESEELIPAYRVQAVDVTAAGDAFNGALAVALAEGKGIREAVAFANAAGALAATRPGAQPSLATRDEVERFIREQTGSP
jgi:ribokinase